MRNLSASSPIERSLRSRGGAVAVEFALVAAPFIFILFAIIEIGMIFVANINLSNATMALARQIRTGGVMAAGVGATSSIGSLTDLADFKTAICKRVQVVPMGTCMNQLQVDVRTQASFSSQSAPNPLSNGNFNNASFCFYSGSSGSVVEFRAYYLWPVVTPILLSALVNASTYTVGGSSTQGKFYVLASSEAFKIEQNASGANNGSGC